MSAPSSHALNRYLIATLLLVLLFPLTNSTQSLHAQQMSSEGVRREIPRKLRLLVVPLAFRNHEPTPGRSTEQIEEMVFGSYPSLDHFYRSNSLGKFKMEGTVTDWIHMIVDEPPDFPVSPWTNAQYYFWAMDTAFDSLAAMVDLSAFDADADSTVDAIIFLHSKQNGSSWSAEGADPIWKFRGMFFEEDGYHLGWYLLAPAGYSLSHLINSFASNYLHLPRMDDADGSSSGLGVWSRLSSGSGNLDAYSRFILGWVGFNSIWETRHNQDLWSAPLTPSTTVLRLVPDASALNEFFLLEYRRKEGYDSSLPGEGLLVYHVDYSVWSNDDETHPRVRIIQADGLQDLEAGRNDGDDGDPFPGSSRVFSVPDRDLQPSLQTYSGNPSGLTIADIRLFPDHLVLSIGVDEVLPDREKYLDPEQDLVIYPTVANLSSPGAMFSFINQCDQSMDIDIIDRGGRILNHFQIQSRQTHEWRKQDWGEIYPLPSIVFVRVKKSGDGEETRKLMILP